jgi:membrane protein
MNREHIPFRFRDAAFLIQVAFQNWQDDKAPRMGAALAYYIALSLAPTVLFLLAITVWAFGDYGAGGRFMKQIQGLVGDAGATAIRGMIENARRSSRGIPATVLGLITVFFAASTAMGELTDALNTIWRVPVDTTISTLRSAVIDLKSRLISFALVLAAGFFLVMSLSLNIRVFAGVRYLNAAIALPGVLIELTGWGVSFLLTTAFFAFIFKVLPHVPLRWSDVAAGAVGTATLFVAGKVFLGLYLANAAIGSTYGAAGSLVVVLVWVYYSAQVLYLGAEFTRAYTYRFGSLYSPETHSSLWQVQRAGLPPTSRVPGRKANDAPRSTATDVQ